MPHDRVLMEDKFTADEEREAIRLFSAAKRHGRTGEIPEWALLAKRQYHRHHNRKYKIDHSLSGQSDEITIVAIPALKPDSEIDPDVTDIIDWVAVEIAVKGTRVVGLTRNERVLAVAWLLEHSDLSYLDIAGRIGMAQISTIVRDIRERGLHKDLLAAIEAGDIETSGTPLNFDTSKTPPRERREYSDWMPQVGGSKKLRQGRARA
jgi:hypothetical protein